ncbi:MAG TPA: L,D-transpeptidase family protein, partial [Nitriliruptorales bacterium]|nr:L,D-transpeptidase family protein [Nitriliruptorales bacterium]
AGPAGLARGRRRRRAAGMVATLALTLAVVTAIAPSEAPNRSVAGRVDRSPAGARAGGDRVTAGTLAQPAGHDHSAPASSLGPPRPVVVPSTRANRMLLAELTPGDRGPDVAFLQRRLRELHLDPGQASGYYGLETLYAVWTLQKLHGLAPDGRVTSDLWRRINWTDPNVPPLVAGGGPGRVEIDLARQLLFLYDGRGDLELVTHVSSGNGERFCTRRGGCRRAVTPAGDYRFSWRWQGWRESDLGLLYNPVYFHGGLAVHGSPSVPTHPASHGCVRIPMHIAEYFPTLVERDDPVHVRG